ncbi:acyl-CoA-like ligand-binding transcription factor [Nocardia farcinica]|uniref:acyl-CoA-like ligand-binding transcription factor n=1 Tax=Nocardia farcinica TaxID=37329 RepID=UPI0037A044FB
MTRTTRRGRPPGTDSRRLEAVALELFAIHGFERTTVEQIAAAAGVSRRTFFRYYDSKTAVLWYGFEREVEAVRLALTRTPADVPVLTAIRLAVLEVNRARTEDVAELRRRIRLLATAPEPAADAERRYHAWERAIHEFAAHRTGAPADSLVPVTIGRVVLAACRAAYDHWATHEGGSLIDHLDTALRALETGFAGQEHLAPPDPPF